MRIVHPRTGICALCNTTSDLVKSHVIPKFIFRKIKEGKESYHKISPNPSFVRRKGQEELDERIFCRHCDTVTLRSNESYFANLFFEKGNLHEKIQPGGDHLVLDRIDYGKIQRCLLSILWRMSLAKAEYFNFVQLDDKNSEEIRNCLLSRDAFPETAYPIICTIPTIKGQSYSDWMATPYFADVNGNTVYHCLIAGFFFSFFIGGTPLPEFVTKLTLRNNGTWVINQRDLKDIPSLYEFFAKSIGSHDRGT